MSGQSIFLVIICLFFPSYIFVFDSLIREREFKPFFLKAGWTTLILIMVLQFYFKEISILIILTKSFAIDGKVNIPSGWSFIILFFCITPINSLIIKFVKKLSSFLKHNRSLIWPFFGALVTCTISASATIIAAILK
ncbi:hypothetical protein GSH19_05110 [Lactobacillus sp. S2-2]|uniref:hypothetical protein n=1 Tax=Lactobacillus sp. S2-2 TaxID=2692917 RepID=UPI001F2D6F30|nr:hypothetical protein [Lactobacillus sp. S2-2]MCF6515531.1 hypothetical protein [Lactobacillus sp. S2-2]